MKAEPVRCPSCGRRLFDLDLSRAAFGTVRIKCHRCKTLVCLDLATYNNQQQERSLPASPKASEPIPCANSAPNPVSP